MPSVRSAAWRRSTACGSGAPESCRSGSGRRLRRCQRRRDRACAGAACAGIPVDGTAGRCSRCDRDGRCVLLDLAAARDAAAFDADWLAPIQHALKDRSHWRAAPELRQRRALSVIGTAHRWRFWRKVRGDTAGMKAPRIVRAAALPAIAPDWPTAASGVAPHFRRAWRDRARRRSSIAWRDAAAAASAASSAPATLVGRRDSREQQRIVVVGDFDCDGATGTAVAVRGLRLLGARNVGYGVPNRAVHGYGLSPAAGRRAACATTRPAHHGRQRRCRACRQSPRRKRTACASSSPIIICLVRRSPMPMRW